MYLPKSNVWDLVLYDFDRGLKAAESAHYISSAFGEDNVFESMAQEWFPRFNTEDYDV